MAALAVAMIGTTVLGCAAKRSTDKPTPSASAYLGGGKGVNAGASSGDDGVAATPSPTPSSTPSKTQSDVTPAACLTGSWKLQNETFEAVLAGLIAEAQDVPQEVRSGMTLALSGDSFIRFDGTDVYTAWQDDFTMSIALAGQQMRHVITSDDAATYVADDEYIAVTDFLQLHWEAEMVIDGVATVVSEQGNPAASIHFFGMSVSADRFERELLDGAARYECTAQQLTLHTDDGVFVMFTRVS